MKLSHIFVKVREYLPLLLMFRFICVFIFLKGRYVITGCALASPVTTTSFEEVLEIEQRKEHTTHVY